jgi:hypothetical protein
MEGGSVGHDEIVEYEIRELHKLVADIAYSLRLLAERNPNDPGPGTTYATKDPS